MSRCRLSAKIRPAQTHAAAAAQVLAGSRAAFGI